MKQQNRSVKLQALVTPAAARKIRAKAKREKTTVSNILFEFVQGLDK